MNRRNAPEPAPESDVFPGALHPRETSTLVGHDDAEAALLDNYRAGRMPQAIVLGGPEGIGKATMAWRLTRFLLAHPDPNAPEVRQARTLDVPPAHPVAQRLTAMSHGDVLLLRREWNEKSKRHFTEISVEDVRRALDLFHHSASGDGWRVCIVDCVEDLNRNGANALLKVIEEPPPRSLFLIVSHRPGRILPTIRSRSRLLALHPLTPANIVKAIAEQGDAGPDESTAAITAAAGRASGSVRQALRLLDADRLSLADRVDRLLGGLPNVDLIQVHDLGEKIAGTAAAEEFEQTILAIYDWLDGRVVEGAGQGADRLAPYALVWDKIAETVRETEALNLDKRPLILSIFSDLAAAERTARRR